MGSGTHARGVASGWLIGAAAAVVLLGASIAPFLLQPVVRVEQDRAGVGELTGYSADELDAVTGVLLADLVLWRGDFDVVDRLPAGWGGGPVLSDAERSHMRDVRVVFAGLWLLVLAGLATLVLGFRRARTAVARADAWRSVAAGARALALVIAVIGVFAIVAFDVAFEVFHRLFFSGNYTFDPRTDKLVQLFPMQFWSEISTVVGAVVLGAAILTAWLAGRRAARLAMAP